MHRPSFRASLVFLAWILSMMVACGGDDTNPVAFEAGGPDALHDGTPQTDGASGSDAEPDVSEDDATSFDAAQPDASHSDAADAGIDADAGADAATDAD